MKITMVGSDEETISGVPPSVESFPNKQAANSNRFGVCYKAGPTGYELPPKTRRSEALPMAYRVSRNEPFLRREAIGSR